jgi:hypothetical protein
MRCTVKTPPDKAAARPPAPRPGERFHSSGAMGSGSTLMAAHQNAEGATFLTIAAFRSVRVCRASASWFGFALRNREPWFIRGSPV